MIIPISRQTPYCDIVDTDMVDMDMVDMDMVDITSGVELSVNLTLCPKCNWAIILEIVHH